MTVEILKFSIVDAEKFSAARQIRTTVFIDEQQVEESEEFDQYEAESYHYLVFDQGKPVGTARWRQVEDKVKLERFAVLKEYRGKKLGDKLLEKVIQDAEKENKPLYLHAQLKAIPFYQRRGFRKVGNLFTECEIEHYKMVK